MGRGPGPTRCMTTSSRRSTSTWLPRRRSRSGNDEGDSPAATALRSTGVPVDHGPGMWLVPQQEVGTGTPPAASSSRRATHGMRPWRRSWFPRITSSSRIDRRYVTQVVVYLSDASTLPVARQVRELRAALSLNKSELARVLRVTRPTVYDWLDGGEPNADNVARIGQLLRLVSQARVSSRNPALPALCPVSARCRRPGPPRPSG